MVQVEPFNRGLRELAADVMINGRRQDHGAERAHIEVKFLEFIYYTFLGFILIICSFSMYTFMGKAPAACSCMVVHGISTLTLS